MMKQCKRISVVIAIRDWEPKRLELAVRSHMESSIGEEVELIVSDFGSHDSANYITICEKYGCVYHYTDAQIWSRSQALNAGLSIATSDVMVTTDADIIFAPRTLEATVDFLDANPSTLVLRQCADLGEEFVLDEAWNLSWSKIYADAVLRPRWGMGGLCAFTRDTFEAVRGFEERMIIWGAEDNDFVKRCRQAGCFLHWVDGPDVGIYHVWHPPFMQTDPNAKDIFDVNRKILLEDSTIARNYVGSVKYKPRQPLVSVHIAAYNRGHLISEAIESVLGQTVQDFELLIYDDGSEDDTEEVVTSFGDERIRYINDGVNGGVANARNRMLEEARGQFVCVHDDDDIMLPNRLELQLDAMTQGLAGNYGGWIDFDPTTTELFRCPGKHPFGVPSVAFVGSVLLHPTLMVRTEVMRRLGYERGFRGGSDYNLAFRLAHAGYRLGHCGDYVILRRVHAESLTGQSQDKQKLSAQITVTPFLNNISNQVEKTLREQGKKVMPLDINPFYDDRALTSFLPENLFDHLIDATEIPDAGAEPQVRFHRLGEPVRHFIVQSCQKGVSKSSPIVNGADMYRIPSLALDPGNKVATEDDVRAIASSLSLHKNVAGLRHVTVIESPPASAEDVQYIVDKHSHLIDAFIIFEWECSSYMAVIASSTSIAKFVALNARLELRLATLRPQPEEEQVKPLLQEVC
ncbi:glycosyltransferase [Granulosicoccus antarcticus]|nr:glycosyltransferase [Granulosicoccus antarcticus]